MKYPLYPPQKLILEGVQLMRGHDTILRDVNFTFQSGTCYSILGPNGIGKTTLLRAICGLLPPAAGRITYSFNEELAHNAHFLAHADGLKASLSVAEQLAFWRGVMVYPSSSALSRGSTSNAPEDPRVKPEDDSVIKSIGLTDFTHTSTAKLSAGQRKRLALGRLLIAPRPIWCLDEPTNTLDAHGLHFLAGMMAQHTQNGGIALVATHIQPLFEGEIAVNLQEFA